MGISMCLWIPFHSVLSPSNQQQNILITKKDQRLKPQPLNKTPTKYLSTKQISFVYCYSNSNTKAKYVHVGFPCFVFELLAWWCFFVSVLLGWYTNGLGWRPPTAPTVRSITSARGHVAATRKIADCWHAAHDSSEWRSTKGSFTTHHILMIK